MVWPHYSFVGKGVKVLTTVYRLQKYKFYYYDSTDNENVEEGVILGYFDSNTELLKAIKICNKYGISEEELKVDEFSVNISSNQKYLYILSYSYSLLIEGKYIDYDYVFEPKTSQKKCSDLKNKLLLEQKYQYNENKIYDSEMPDGFWVEKCKINKLYSVISIK